MRSLEWEHRRSANALGATQSNRTDAPRRTAVEFTVFANRSNCTFTKSDRVKIVAALI